MAAELPPDLVARLRDAGVAWAPPFDPAATWDRLFDRIGRRATLADRWALEAAARGVSIGDLDSATKHRLTLEIVPRVYPGFEWTSGEQRASQERIDVTPYDATWPARFASMRARLAAALGAVALRIDHVGSTSVPGLAAKPIVDVQVSVRDHAHEAAYVPAIEELGFVLRARDDQHRYFKPPPGSPRTHQIHVCSAGGDWERDHLLFRDYLRAHPARADEYGALKTALALKFGDDRVGYTDAKTSFILDALELASRWAASVGWQVGAVGPRAGRSSGGGR